MKNFIDWTQKAQIAKENINTFDCIKWKTLAQKDIINIVKPHNRKIICNSFNQKTISI